MPSLNKNEKIACLKFGKEYTGEDASRHCKHCGFFKCYSCNFYTYSSEEFNNHIEKKHNNCQHNVKLCAQQSRHILQEKVEIIHFLKKNLGEKFLNNKFY